MGKRLSFTEREALIDRQQRRRHLLNFKAEAVLMLLARWPEAYKIQQEDYCPNCGDALRFYSFMIDGPHNRPQEFTEFCGYYCAGCGWSNAGSRAMAIRKRGNRAKRA